MAERGRKQRGDSLKAFSNRVAMSTHFIRILIMSHNYIRWALKAVHEACAAFKKLFQCLYVLHYLQDLQSAS